MNALDPLGLDLDSVEEGARVRCARTDTGELLALVGYFTRRCARGVDIGEAGRVILAVASAELHRRAVEVAA